MSEAKFTMLNRANRATQLARMMVEMLFTREELATSSVTGRVSNKPGAIQKKALNADKISAILGMYKIIA